MSDQQEKEAAPIKTAKKEEAAAPRPASVEQSTPAGTRAAPQGSEPGLAPGEGSPNPAQDATVMAARSAVPVATKEATGIDSSDARVRAMVYIGPARPFGVPLMPHAILRGEPAAVIPELGEAMQKHPSLARLFVPVTRLAQARQELAKAGSGLGIIYRDIQAASAKARTA